MMQIEDILQSNPSKIARNSEIAEEYRYRWQQMKEIYNNKEAIFVLTLKAKQDVKATEIKYYVNEDEGLYINRLDIVKGESEYRKRECGIKALEEELRSAKMLARIRISEWESQLEFKGGKK